MRFRGLNLQACVPNPGNEMRLAARGMGFLQSSYVRLLTDAKVGGKNTIITSPSFAMPDSSSRILKLSSF